MESITEKSLQIRALSKAVEFIENGIELGFIRMPDAQTNDSAHQTLPLLKSALNEALTGTDSVIGKLTMTVHTNTAHLRKLITDLAACDVLAAKFKTVDGYRAELQKGIEKTITNTYSIDHNIALMPRELTAENGAKAGLIGEFNEELELPCPECNEDEWNAECEWCDGNGYLHKKVPVEWTTIKAIYAKAVEVCEVKELP